VKVLGLSAQPDLRGNQIDIAWMNPDFADFKGVKVLRREGTYPEVPSDVGSEFQIHDEPASATSAGSPASFSDAGLKSETVYYYAVVAYDSVPQYFPAFTAAMTTGSYQSAELMYRYLPSLYRRFDTSIPPTLLPRELDPADAKRGQLLRMIEIFGLQVDLLRSFAKGVRDFSSIDRVDGELLPLLAEWIGWDTSFNLSLAKQRNEIKYAPHFYRTTGIAANLRATLNRVSSWDVQIKEFVHNVFRSNDPEQLQIWEIEKVGVASSAPQLVTLDRAYEGKPAALQAADKRVWLFYHSRQAVPLRQGPQDHWQIYYKVKADDEWLPSRGLSQKGSVNKYPTALQRADGSFWLFWAEYQDPAGRGLPQIQLAVFSAGRPAQPAVVAGTTAGPFSFVDGETFGITVTVFGVSTLRTVTFHAEYFADMTNATAGEVADLLTHEVPGIKASATEDGTIRIATAAAGAAASVNISASTVAAKLGFAAGTSTGVDATTAAPLTSKSGPFALSDGDTLVIRTDSGSTTTVAFRTVDFANIASATAAEVATVINGALPGVATSNGAGKLQLISTSAGEASLVMISVNGSNAAAALGFAMSLPPATPQPIDDTEPSAFEDGSGNVWLFWSSMRPGVWNIWYNRFDGTAWGTAKPLTQTAFADREPSAVFDPSGRIWVSWSRKKANGLWNIFYRTTKVLDFSAILDTDWDERELTPAPPNFENRESAAVVTAPDAAELYFSSSVNGGWHIRSAVITPTTQAPDQAITTGQFSHRAPATIRVDGSTHLWFRSNQSVQYQSKLYPAANTVDARYAGSLAWDVTNATKIGNRGTISDVERYSYDTGKGDANWYARDTLGIFLTADTTNKKVIEQASLVIDNTIKRFLPIQVRTVLVVIPPGV
jgi:hypothetical protein